MVHGTGWQVKSLLDALGLGRWCEDLPGFPTLSERGGRHPRNGHHTRHSWWLHLSQGGRASVAVPSQAQGTGWESDGKRPSRQALLVVALGL